MKLERSTCKPAKVAPSSPTSFTSFRDRAILALISFATPRHSANRETNDKDNVVYAHPHTFDHSSHLFSLYPTTSNQQRTGMSQIPDAWDDDYEAIVDVGLLSGMT